MWIPPLNEVLKGAAQQDAAVDALSSAWNCRLRFIKYLGSAVVGGATELHVMTTKLLWKWGPAIG
jgi:hypothetical protein